MIGQIAYPWVACHKENLAAADISVDAVRDHFTIPQLCRSASFRVIILAYGVGNITVSLRFGHRDADADLATEGVDFVNLAAVNLSSLRSVNFSVGAALPSVAGSSPAYLPPRVAVRTVGAAVTTLEWVLLCALTAELG